MNFLQPKSTLTECDREPIHHIGAVQPFGAMIVLNGDWVVAQRSLNCAELLELDTLPEVGTPLDTIAIPRALELLHEALGRIDGDNQVARVFGFHLTSGGPMLDCAIHPSGGKIVIELEHHSESEYANHIAMVGPAFAWLEPIRDPQTLFDETAAMVREMLGYDRVMVYRFRPDDSGEVVAEARRDDLEPYLGLRYPKSDIPQQARELFVRNRFRIISDMGAAPVPVEPLTSIDGAPLDLSMSVLRAHSQMHVQYMQNMGVEASLTIAIVRNGQLWGMISCHHYAPRHLPYSLRTVAEMFNQMFSLLLDRLLVSRSEELRARGRHLHDQLMQRLAGGTSLATSLPLLDDMLADVIAHDGASVLINGVYTARGVAPSEEQFEALRPALDAAPISSIVASSSLADQIPEAAAMRDDVAGALILPISRAPRDFLILWRKPLVQTVTWAGNPAKAIAPEGERLEPRGSFAAWQETVEGCSEDWSEDELIIAEGLRVTLLEVVLRMTDEVARERKRAAERQELLIAELNHRVRNILNLIRSLVSQSQDEALSVSSFATIIGGRIAALASAHDNITRENWAPAPLSSLFETELAAYLNEKRSRFTFNGDEVLVKPEAYTVLALVVHELVTNSAKYGSLCDSQGRLQVDVSKTRGGDLKIAWREIGGPPVKAPMRRGFGSTIIERSIPFELKGEADLRFKLTGLEADFLLPARYFETAVQNTGSASGGQSALEAAGFASTRQGRMEPDPGDHLPAHVLVVEDSMIIALDTEENLKRLGVKSVQVESSVAGALAAINRCEPDFAIIDFNLGEESSTPIAAELGARGVRFVMATGYADMNAEIDALGAEGVIHKPYGREEIEQLLDQR